MLEVLVFVRISNDGLNFFICFDPQTKRQFTPVEFVVLAQYAF